MRMISALCLMLVIVLAISSNALAHECLLDNELAYQFERQSKQGNPAEPDAYELEERYSEWKDKCATQLMKEHEEWERKADRGGFALLFFFVGIPVGLFLITGLRAEWELKNRPRD